jgi:hypothetical protein
MHRPGTVCLLERIFNLTSVGERTYSNPGLAESDLEARWQRLILPLNHRCERVVAGKNGGLNRYIDCSIVDSRYDKSENIKKKKTVTRHYAFLTTQLDRYT